MIKIETEKIVKGKEKYVKILSFKLLGKKDLPEKYVEGNPAVWFFSCSPLAKMAIRFSVDRYSLRQGDVLTEETFLKRLEYIKAAGNRLQRINLEEKELRKTWNDKETICI